MDDLIEEAIGAAVVVRRAEGTDIDVRADGAGPPLVGLTSGTLWVRVEPGGAGLDLGHGSINVVVREGTVLLDAQGGSGLVIVLQGEVEISSGGLPVARAEAGDALGFDATGGVGEPDPVDATELAHDPFVSLNLVLDALAGAPVGVGATPEPAPAAAPAEDAPVAPERKRGKGLFARTKRSPGPA